MKNRFLASIKAKSQWLVIFIFILLAPATIQAADLKIFAASSLRMLLEEAIVKFTKTHPKVKVLLTTQGSQILKFQIQHGAKPDIFLSADLKFITDLVAQGFISPNHHGMLCQNELVLIESPYSAVELQKITDIAEKDVRLVLGAPNAPFGFYAREIIKNIESYGYANFEKKARANLISQEINVSNSLAKISLGLADAALVYYSDLFNNSAQLKIIEIPDEYQVKIYYGYGILQKSLTALATKKVTMAFITYLTSTSGQKLFADYGFKTL